MIETKDVIFDRLISACDIVNLFLTLNNQVLTTMKEPTTGLRHSNMDTIREIINQDVNTLKWLDIDGKDADLFLMSPFYMMDLYIIDGHDMDLTNYPYLSRPTAFTMWKTMKYNVDDDDPDTVKEKLVCIVVVGEASPFIVSTSNRLHIIRHELVHCILSYLEFNSYINLLELTDGHGELFTEFLCDFIPFYAKGIESDDYNNISMDQIVEPFVTYITEFFEEEVADKYKEYLGEISNTLDYIFQLQVPF